MCKSPKIIITYGKNADNKYITTFHPWSPELEKFCLDTDRTFYKVGCGRCIECRLEYSKKWAVRLELQRKMSKNAYFVTLTYNDEHLPKNGSLNKRDFQLFLKRLRKYCGKSDIKYFLCGEYGDTTFRCHGHCILFNLPFDDLTEFFPVQRNGKILKKHLYSKTGEMLYYSPKLEELWSNGNVQVTPANIKTMQYVARYCIKKQYGNGAVIYEKLGVTPPFLMMSQGIAKDYLLANQDKIYQDDAVYVLKDGEARRYKPPRYFDKIVALDKPQLIEKIKKNRQDAILFDEIEKINQTDEMLVHDVLKDSYRKSYLTRKIKRDIL